MQVKRQHAHQETRPVQQTVVRTRAVLAAVLGASAVHSSVTGDAYSTPAHERLVTVSMRRHAEMGRRYSGLTVAKNLVMVATGILTGLVCFGINSAVDALADWRNVTMGALLARYDSSWPAFGFNLAYALALVLSAACLVRSVRAPARAERLLALQQRAPGFPQSSSNAELCQQARRSKRRTLRAQCLRLAQQRHSSDAGSYAGGVSILERSHILLMSSMCLRSVLRRWCSGRPRRRAPASQW